LTAFPLLNTIFSLPSLDFHFICVIAINKEKAMPKSLVYLALISLFSLFPDNANAGKLHFIHSVCEEYQSAAAVFTAYVTDVQRAEKKSNSTNAIRRWATISMKIEQAFKGVKESDIVFTQIGDFEDCSLTFTTGERWLIYAIRDPKTNALRPMECSRNRKVELASSDIRYIQALPEIATKTRLAGSIAQYMPEWSRSYRYFKPLSGIKVTVTNQQGDSYEGYSEADGFYEFAGLPAGTYKIHTDIPKYLKVLDFGKKDVEVTLIERGCAEANISAISEGSISGKVTDQEGKSVPNLRITLISADEKPYPIEYTVFVLKITDEQGQFEIKELPPGNYFIGINIDSQPSGQAPFPGTFYPGVSTRSQATTLTLAEGEKISNLTLRLPARLATRVIEGTLVYSDGQVVNQGYVHFSDSDKTRTYMIYATSKVSEDGRFSLRVLKDMAGWIHAYGSEHPKAFGQGISYVMPMKIEAIEDIKNLKIIIPLP
jgi:hypothetical protein